MNIDEAVVALESGETINSANSHETITAKEGDLGYQVTTIRKLPNGKDDVMTMALSRFRQLYSPHVFALGSYKEPGKTTKQAAPTETK